MDKMQSKATNMLRVLLGLALGIALMGVSVSAQQPSPSPKKSDDAKTQTSATENGEDAGNYTIISSIEFGYRGISVDGNNNKYRSDLNYKAGPRLFDSTFLMKAKDGKKNMLFDTLLVTSTGWGADPYSNLRINIEKPQWYRFNATQRRFKYYRFLNNFVNPNYVFTGGTPAVITASSPPDPITGDHGIDARTQIGDYDLTILPNNRLIRFNIGFSPERYYGPAFTTWHYGGDDFILLSELRTKSVDWRVGADGKVGPIDYSFLQGFREFRDDSFILNIGQNIGANPLTTSTTLNSLDRDQSVKGKVRYTRLSLHSLIARKLDLTGRIIYSRSTSNYGFTEAFSALNFNARFPAGSVTPAVPSTNTLNLGQYNFAGDASRPQTLADFGVTYLATSKLRISNTFRYESFQINGGNLYNTFFNYAGRNPIIFNNNGFGYGSSYVTKYRKYQNTIEGDYDFNDHYSVFFGYRYGSRWVQELRRNQYNLGSNVPGLLDATLPPTAFLENTVDNHTNSFFGGINARPTKNWMINFSAETGTADNIFTRIGAGNYDYNYFRVRTRYVPNRRLTFTASFNFKNNSNPSEINGIGLSDFAVEIRSRYFTSTIDWTPNSRFAVSGGYTYNWLTSNAVIEYTYAIPPATVPPNSTLIGNSQYYMRNHFFYVNTSVQITPRIMLYATYRINKDTGQGDRIQNPLAVPGLLITSYPMSYQSPEARLSVKLNRWLDWNVGYQYYNYRESPLVSLFPQNYHAHLPYTSLRLYFGRKE
jgi:hypothetical protein